MKAQRPFSCLQQAVMGARSYQCGCKKILRAFLKLFRLKHGLNRVRVRDQMKAKRPFPSLHQVLKGARSYQRGWRKILRACL